MESLPGIATHAGLLGPKDLSSGVAALFERAVRFRPDAPALCVPGNTWTYAELNSRANRLARVLIASGIGRGEVVAIAAESPPSLAVAMLGALKAGNPTVFLDLKSPKSRLSEILADSGASTLLTDGESPKDHVVDDGGQDALRIIDLSRTADASAENPGIPADGQDLMALFYTSGTTSRPKGICRSQSQAIFEAWTFVREMSVTPDDRLLMPVSFTFGASTRYALGALLSGATLCPVSPDTLGMSALVRFAREVRATHYYSTPSLFRHFCKAAASEPGSDTIRAVTLTGEPARQTDLQLFRALMGGRPGVLLNSLGSTECGAYCHLRVTPDLNVPDEILPAGVPLEGKDVFIVDDERRPVRNGETGEIAVRSAYLARGYWRRPDLNQQAFAVDSEGSSLPVFYTGDLGVRDEKGWIRVTGRKDFQLKVRGYRVEPGEIEAVLVTYPGIRAAAVVAGDASGQKILEAYLQPEADSAHLDRADLDRHLMRHLPSYMLPARYRVLDDLPLTERGKVDRRALSRSPFRALESSKDPSAPSSPILEELRLIWSDLLRSQPPPTDSNFFELGGDSVLAIHFLTRVRSRWGLAIPVAVFYQSPTLDSAARWIQAGTAFGPDSAVFPMNDPQEGLPELIFLPGWMRNTLELQPLARGLAGRFNCLGLELPPGEARKETIEELAAYCAGIIRSRKPGKPIFLGGFSLGGLLAYETALQLSNSGIPVAHVFILDSALSALLPRSGLPRFFRFLRNAVAHPLRSVELVLRRGWFRIGRPVLERLPLASRARRMPSNFGPMPQREAARSYRPNPSNLHLTLAYSWERRLQIAFPGEHWNRLTPHPIHWRQIDAFDHERLVKPENLPQLLDLIHPLPLNR